MFALKDKIGALKNAYILGILTVCYIVGELGHYLIGVTSRATARDIIYGDQACQLNATTLEKNEMPTQCEEIM